MVNRFILLFLLLSELQNVTVGHGATKDCKELLGLVSFLFPEIQRSSLQHLEFKPIFQLHELVEKGVGAQIIVRPFQSALERIEGAKEIERPLLFRVNSAVRNMKESPETAPFACLQNNVNCRRVGIFASYVGKIDGLNFADRATFDRAQPLDTLTLKTRKFRIVKRPSLIVLRSPDLDLSKDYRGVSNVELVIAAYIHEMTHYLDIQLLLEWIRKNLYLVRNGRDPSKLFLRIVRFDESGIVVDESQVRFRFEYRAYLATNEALLILGHNFESTLFKKFMEQMRVRMGEQTVAEIAPNVPTGFESKVFLGWREELFLD